MSMLLKGQNGNEFELSFVRDSLVEPQDGFGDSRWATVLVRGANQDDTWEESSPCMNFYEFQNLADWLAAVGAGEDGPGETDSVELLEPDLKFSLSNQSRDAATIRIGFHLPDRPDEFNVDAQMDDSAVLDVFMPRENIRTAARTLRSELARLNLTPKDDLEGGVDAGVLGEPDPGLNIVDEIKPNPPGAGRGEDNAGNR
ncbi:MAG: WapI family immunity protein [Phycisphaerales bacterium]